MGENARCHLVRHKSSGIYFARVRVRNKLIRQTLKTDVMSVSKLRLADLVKDAAVLLFC